MKNIQIPFYCGAFGFYQMGEGELVGISAASVVNRMLELKLRVLEKLRSGYDLTPHETQIP